MSLSIQRKDVHHNSWKFARTIVMDGNFKAEHMKPKNAEAEIWLMDGKGYMVTSGAYKNYITGTVNKFEVCMLIRHAEGICALMEALAVGLQQSPNSETGQCTKEPTGCDWHWWRCLCTSWMFHPPCHG